MDYTGAFKIWNGQVSGLHSFQRGGNVCLISNREGTASLEAILEISGIRARANASYRVKIAFVRKTFKGDVNAKIDRMRVKIGISADLKNRQLQLTEWAVQEISGFDLKISLKGFWKVFNFIANKFINKNKLSNKGQEEIRKAIVKGLQNFKGWDKLPF